MTEKYLTRFDKFMGRLPICLSGKTSIPVRYQDTKNSDTNLSIRVVKHGILYLDPTSTSIYIIEILSQTDKHFHTLLLLQNRDSRFGSITCVACSV